MPHLYIITGSNGAGKSSVGKDYLPVNFLKKNTVFDGDKLFVQKSREFWDGGIKISKIVKKKALEIVVETFENLVADALESKRDFAYEGHFTNDATWDIPKKFKKAGYNINIIYFGLNNPDLSEFRVVERSRAGGHFVDRKIIEDNFYGNLDKLNQNCEIADNLTIVNTSEAQHKALVIFKKGKLLSSVPKTELPDWFTFYLPHITEKISSNLP